MQTFLPYVDFVRSAAVLDNKRLGKQRVEVKQIYFALLSNSTSHWRNHPAVLMWKGYEVALLQYGKVICEEWKSRKFNDSLFDFFAARLIGYDEFPLPLWIGNEEFHASHRSNLLRKDLEHYRQYGWLELDDLPYYWPTKEGY